LRQIVGDLDPQVLTVILSGAAGVLAWLATKYNWVGKPIVDARDKRLTALQAAEQNRIVAARTALNDAASALRSVRPYCWFAR